MWAIAVLVLEKAKPAWTQANATLVRNFKFFKSVANKGRFWIINFEPAIPCIAEIGLAFMFQILSIEWERASNPVEIVKFLGLSNMILGSIIAFCG